MARPREHERMAMIQVEGLTKAYGPTLAVRDVSFQVQPGELVGFLGKNGAGKTTTMRILAGSLGATEGTATIAGLDVEKSARRVKALVGYLPEVPPLYPDMTTRAYLRFAARIKGVDNPREAVDRSIERVGLTGMAGRVIGHLSKGYRQRVGIAQAIVHDPKVLILDEPLSGLDPAQRREIRELVAALAAGDTTVLLSTHVLQEIEAICDRVIVLHGGRVVAEDSIADLAGSTSRVLVRVARPEAAVLQALESLEGVTQVVDEGHGRWALQADRDVREDVAQVAVRCGLLELRTRDSLEDAFLRLTEGSTAPTRGTEEAT
jgi:ABC-2 type transport system ATP-binding protein